MAENNKVPMANITRFMFYQKYWILLGTGEILIGTWQEKTVILSTVASEIR